MVLQKCFKISIVCTAFTYDCINVTLPTLPDLHVSVVRQTVYRQFYCAKRSILCANALHETLPGTFMLSIVMFVPCNI